MLWSRGLGFVIQVFRGLGAWRKVCLQDLGFSASSSWNSAMATSGAIARSLRPSVSAAVRSMLTTHC